jgi:hypothetical protein
MKEADFLYVNGPYWVCRKGKGFEVYRDGITHATRVATIGFEGQDGLERAKAVADRRANMDADLQSDGGE